MFIASTENSGNVETYLSRAREVLNMPTQQVTHPVSPTQPEGTQEENLEA